MDRAAVAIFVKTPGLSPIKTRLARDIGEAQALAVYRRLLELTERQVRDAAATGLIDGYFAVAEEDAMGDPLWSSLPVVAQGEGDLGMRLAKVYTELEGRYRRVLLIGADCPELTAELLLEAAAGERFTVGPAVDGGFYLFAGSTPLPSSLWQGVEYSAATTAKMLIDRLSAFGAVQLLPTLADIDTVDDLNRLRNVLGIEVGVVNSGD